VEPALRGSSDHFAPWFGEGSADEAIASIERYGQEVLPALREG